jgi:adenylate kinase
MLATKGRTFFPPPRTIVFIGAPGSGKGTQSFWLSAQLGIPCLSTGEILRSEAKRNTPAGFRLRQVLASGSLVSDEMVCGVVAARLKCPDDGAGEKRQTGVILDGFPRSVKQAAFLDDHLAAFGLPHPTVIHLEVSPDRLQRRLKARRQCARCGAIYNLKSRPSVRGSRCENDGGALIERDDDAEGVVLRRLAEFERSSAAVTDYYRDADYHRVDGDREPEQVASDLMRIVTQREARVAA